MLNTIQQLISQGENAQIEFKSVAVSPDAIAREMVAFANNLGGTLLIGVEDDGTVSGINTSSLDEWVANISRNNITPALQVSVEHIVLSDKTLCVVTVPKVTARRTETVLIPLKVIREAVVNAVAHRDYSLSQRKIQVYVFSDRIEITSPGKLANTLTLAKIRYGNSAPRNIFLVKFLDNLRYFDGLGRGIPMMLKLMQERVVFEEIGALFRVTLRFF